MNINKQTLSNALDSASFPVLAVSLVHLTGDISILSKLPKPRQAVLGETQGFYTDLEKNIIKNLALEEITNFFINDNFSKYSDKTAPYNKCLELMIPTDVTATKLEAPPESNCKKTIWEAPPNMMMDIA